MNEKEVNVFIVDDDKLFTESLVQELVEDLKDKSVKVHLFETGEDCLRKLEELKPKVIILDYHLDSVNPFAKDGLVILEEIKKICPGTKIIMLTIDGNIEVAVSSFSFDVDEHILKGDIKELKSSLIRLLE